VARIARDLAFEEKQKQFQKSVVAHLERLELKILGQYELYAEAAERQDFPAQLRILQQIEKYERVEAALKRQLPKPPPPPPKPLSRGEQWSAAQKQQYDDSVRRSTAAHARAQANWEAAQSDALSQSFEDYWDAQDNKGKKPR
jgi:hypothetical protein